MHLLFSPFINCILNSLMIFYWFFFSLHFHFVVYTVLGNVLPICLCLFFPVLQSDWWVSPFACFSFQFWTFLYSLIYILAVHVPLNHNHRQLLHHFGSKRTRKSRDRHSNHTCRALPAQETNFIITKSSSTSVID